MDYIGTHANHVDVHVAIKKDIVGQVFNGLPRQADHIACTDLIAYAFQGLETVAPHSPFVMAVLGMQRLIKVRIARFNTEQIAMGTGFKPTAIRVLGLFAYTKGNA